MSSGATWIMGADRAQAVAGYDGAGPRILGAFSKRYGTPIAVNAFSGIVSSVFMMLAFQLTNGNTAKYFSAALGLAISTTTVSYLAIFPALWVLRRKYPDVHRPYRVPFGNAGRVRHQRTDVRVGGARDRGAALARPRAVEPRHAAAKGLRPYAGVGKHAAQRWQYEEQPVVPLLFIILLGVVFYWLGAPTRRQEVDVPLQTGSDGRNSMIKRSSWRSTARRNRSTRSPSRRRSRSDVGAAITVVHVREMMLAPSSAACRGGSTRRGRGACRHRHAALSTPGSTRRCRSSSRRTPAGRRTDRARWPSRWTPA